MNALPPVAEPMRLDERPAFGTRSSVIVSGLKRMLSKNTEDAPSSQAQTPKQNELQRKSQLLPKVSNLLKERAAVYTFIGV